MQLKHSDIWRAIDRLAEQNGLSASGLARKSGLSPTVFNPSKRVFADRKRWPSTESIAYILRATDTKFEDFVMLASAAGAVSRATLPMLSIEAAQKETAFDEEGFPATKGWAEIRFPTVNDPHAFALEIGNKDWEPAYREGSRIFVSPAEKARRGDRVVIRLKKGELIIGELGRENARMVEVSVFNRTVSPIQMHLHDIEWMHRIVWASQ